MDHNCADALHVGLQEHQQMEEETTSQLIDFQEELNTSDKKAAEEERGPANEYELNSSEVVGDEEDSESEDKNNIGTL